MTKIFHIFRDLFARESSKPLPLRNEEEKIADPVYHFFVKAKAGARKRAYSDALKAAERDQIDVLRKYETMKT